VDIKAVMKKGDEVEDGDIRRTTFTVEGMDCADEVRLIEDKLGGTVPGAVATGRQ
jgi:hypothetical protein